VGLLGFLTIYRKYMIELTPIILMISLLLVLVNHHEWNRFFILFILSIMIGGFIIEVIGVETGLIFGHYTYGKTLGFQLFNVPLLIGVNWFLLVFSSGMITNLLKTNWFWRALFGAFLMLSLDVSLEPVAMTFDFWSWENYTIPIQNYVFWFIFSFIFQWVFQSIEFEKVNRFAVVLFIVQWIFFMTLSFIINLV
jgi:putative membrane protein